jgi:hypothetical protein
MMKSGTTIIANTQLKYSIYIVEMFPTVVRKLSNLSKRSRQSSASCRICRNVPDGRPQAVDIVEMFPTVVRKPLTLSKISF